MDNTRYNYDFALNEKGQLAVILSQATSQAVFEGKLELVKACISDADMTLTDNQTTLVLYKLPDQVIEYYKNNKSLHLLVLRDSVPIDMAELLFTNH